MKGTTKEKFWKKVEKGEPDQCWNWKASIRDDGYGAFWDGEKNISAHRYAFRDVKGELVAGQVILHSCDNPKCCNPRHLTQGSVAENVADREKKGRRIAPKGESHRSSKATQADIELIRTSSLSVKELMKVVPLGKTQIGDIRRGVYWKR